MPKPKLIFTENHLDPATSLLLTLLIPELIKLGYECYLDEMPTDTTIENHLAKIQHGSELWLKLAIDLKTKHDIDINDPKSLEHEYFKQEEDQLKFIKRHIANLAYKPFLRILADQQIKYVGIDTNPDASDFQREMNMAKAYLKTKLAVFGRMGRRHLGEFQRQILHVEPVARAKASYCFFDIFSDASAQTSLANEKLPLGVHCFNATGRESAALAFILEKIQQKQQEMDALPQQQVTADSRFSSFISKLISYSLFSPISAAVIPQKDHKTLISKLSA